MLEPRDRGLVGTTLRYSYEIRDARDYFDDIPEVALEPEMHHYEEAVVELLKKKQAGIAVSRERTAPQPRNVINIIDALRQSVAQEKAASAPLKKSPKHSDRHGEILLPIAGKAQTLAAAKPTARPSTGQNNVG